jgi:N-dimethylarginine dimethylaminohydrolase
MSVRDLTPALACPDLLAAIARRDLAEREWEELPIGATAEDVALACLRLQTAEAEVQAVIARERRQRR